MVLVGYGNCTLESIKPELRWRDGAEVWDANPPVHGFR